jgi:hypothetical protein
VTAKRKAVSIPSTTIKPASDPTMDELLGKPANAAPTPAETGQTASPEPTKAAPRPQMTAYIASDVQEAARAAVWWTRNQPEGYENLSDLLEDALLEKIARLEQQYNDGQPFPPMPAGKRLRRGRPIGR